MTYRSGEELIASDCVAAGVRWAGPEVEIWGADFEREGSS